jgi:beta-lactamase class A
MELGGQHATKRRKPQRWRVALLIVFVVLLSAAATVYILKTLNGESSTEEPSVTKLEVVDTPPPPPPPSIVLTPNATIEKIIKENKNFEIGVGIQDITTGEHKAYGSTDRFTAASTGKLLTAAAYYHEVEEGRQSLNTIIGTRSAQEQLRLMINQSNNDSWERLELHLGLKAITAYAASINCDYITNGNTVTAASMASFLSDLYNGKLLNEKHTKQLLSYMQDTNWETLIPAALPGDITVYHKYGLLTWVIHDVAILVKDDKAYALTVYTAGKDYASNDARAAAIRAITKAAVKQLFTDNTPDTTTP